MPEAQSRIRHEPSRKISGLEKDLMEVLATVGPESDLPNPSRSAVPEFRPRGRGQLQLNHSICWVTTFDAGPVRGIQHSQPTPSARLATLVLDGLSFIPPHTAERKPFITVGTLSRPKISRF